MQLEIVDGDLLAQEVDVIVNAWNRNIIPWWLLIPQGVSGAIKKRGGTAPFRELARFGALPLGSAALTVAGRLPYRGIIHVCGINMIWRASELSIRRSEWELAWRISASSAPQDSVHPCSHYRSGRGRGGTRNVPELDRCESHAASRW